MLVLAISDGLFLLTHFFEDTLRTIIDFYIRNNRTTMVYSECMNESNMTYLRSIDDSIFSIINIVDKFEFSCRFVNFLRHFLRFTSAYLITTFTIHRLIGLYFNSYKLILTTTLAAWKTVVCLIIVAGILNSFLPFLFKLNEDQANFVYVVHCDTDRENGRVYFVTIVIYIIIVMFIPITTIIICNTLIIIQICKARKERTTLFADDLIRKTTGKNILSVTNDLKNDLDETTEMCLKGLNQQNSLEQQNPTESNPFSNTRLILPNVGSCNPCSSDRNNSFIENLTMSQRRKFSKFKRFQISSQRVTRILVIMSLSYTILNLPYFITWSIFYYSTVIEKQNSLIERKYLFGYINIAEVFYVLNYGLHFFLYCASGKRFFNQLSASFRKTNHKHVIAKPKIIT